MAAFHERVPIKSSPRIDHRRRHLKTLVPKHFGTAEVSHGKGWRGPYPQYVAVVGVHAEEHELRITRACIGEIGLSKKHVSVRRGGNQRQTRGKSNIGLAKYEALHIGAFSLGSKHSLGVTKSSARPPHDVLAIELMN